LYFLEQFHEGRLKLNEFLEHQLEFSPFDSVHEQCQSRYCTTSIIHATSTNLATTTTNDESLIAIVAISFLTAVIALLNHESLAIALITAVATTLWIIIAITIIIIVIVIVWPISVSRLINAGGDEWQQHVRARSQRR